MDVADGRWFDAFGNTLGPQRWRLSRPRNHFLFPAVLSALWNPVPCRNVTVQHLFLQAGAGHFKAGALGHTRGALGSVEILRREDLRRFHLEAHPGFLFLCRLRTVCRQLSIEYRWPAAGAAIPDR